MSEKGERNIRRTADGIPLAEHVATLEAELGSEAYQWLHLSAAAAVTTYLRAMRVAALHHDGGEVCRLTALIRRVFEREACYG